MSQIISAAVVVAFAAAFKGALKRHPAAFYALAALVAAAGVYFTFNPNPNGAARAVAFAIQKGHLGFSMLAVVMFVGVFDRGSAVRRALGPVRGELSIMGAILMLAHIVPYLANYVSMAGAVLSLKPSVQSSLVVAVVLLVLLGVLAATSFKAVRARIDPRTWKRVQVLAYPFFLLVFVHLLGYLAVPLRAGAPDVVVGFAFYAVVFASYLVLRARRFVLDKRIEPIERRGAAADAVDGFKEVEQACKRTG